MNSIKKLLTSIKRRGKPILAAFITCLTVVLLSTALPAFYNSLAVETRSSSQPLQLKAWSYKGLSKYKEKAEEWYRAYGVEIDDSVDYAVKEGGGRLDLTEKCNNRPKAPCRYWFWIKANITYGVGAERTAANTLGMLSNSLTSFTAPIADAANPQWWYTAWFQGSSTRIKQPFNAKDGKVDISDDTTKTFEEPETPTGRQNYKSLRDLLTSMKFKIGSGNTQICLVYQQVEKAKIILKTRAFDYDVKSGKHVKDDGSVKDYELGTINSEQDSGPFNLKDRLVKSSSDETSVVDTMEVLGKKYEINHKCANANTKHFLTKISLEYTDLNGDAHTITKGNAPSAELAYKDPHNGGKLWDGTEEDEEAIEAKIKNLFSQVEAGDVDYSEEITIKADYYQPYTPAVTTYYYHYFDKAGNERYAKVYDSTTDAERKRRKSSFSTRHSSQPSRSMCTKGVVETTH